MNLTFSSSDHHHYNNTERKSSSKPQTNMEKKQEATVGGLNGCTELWYFTEQERVRPLFPAGGRKKNFLHERKRSEPAVPAWPELCAISEPFIFKSLSWLHLHSLWIITSIREVSQSIVVRLALRPRGVMLSLNRTLTGIWLRAHE